MEHLHSFKFVLPHCKSEKLNIWVHNKKIHSQGDPRILKNHYFLLSIILPRGGQIFRNKLNLSYQYYKVIRVFVCLSLNNSGTAGPIWLNFFLALYCSGDGFRPIKFRIWDPVFPEIWKNRFWREIIKYFYNRISKIAEIIVTKIISKRLYKFSTKHIIFWGGRAEPPVSGFSC